MRVLFAASVLTMTLAGCAAGPAPQPQAASSEPSGMVCTREYPTGTHFPVTRCRTHAQIEADKASAAEDLKRVQTGGPKVTKGG